MITNLTAVQYNFINGGNKTINSSLTMEQLAYMLLQQDDKSSLYTTLTSLAAFVLMAVVVSGTSCGGRLSSPKRKNGDISQSAGTMCSC